MTRIRTEDSLLLVIDYQEKFVPIIHGMDGVIENANKMIAGADLVGIPIIASEQYPEGLGKTTDRVRLPAGVAPHWKVHFDCFLDGKIAAAVAATGKRTLLVIGIEAHVCVCQSVLSALSLGYQVHVAEDAVSSRRERDARTGIERMRQSGAFIACTEMLLFQMLPHSKDPRFPALSRIVKGG